MKSHYSYRQDAAKRQTAGIRLTHRPNIRFLAPQGRLVAPIQVKLCRTDGHLGPLGRAKFYFNRGRGGNAAPKILKISTYALDQKMNDTFYDGHDELYHHAKFGEEIAQCAPAVGAKMWCFFCLFVTLQVRSTVRSTGA